MSWGRRAAFTLSESSDAVFTDIPLTLPLNRPPVALTLFCLFRRCFRLWSVAGPPAKIQALREQGDTCAGVYSPLYGP